MLNSTSTHNLYTLFLIVWNLSSFVTLILFFVFGIWSIHRRFGKHEEWSMRHQLLVLAVVAAFYLLEVTTLRFMLRESIVQFIFALLGLLVAGLALYGHIIVSVISRLMVEFLIPDNPNAATTPRLGPAEALERQEDWEGALHEYYILARIYPNNPMISVRAANNLVRLNRNEEAVAWFERAIKHTHKAEDNLALVRRLCDTLETLNQPEQINEVLRLFSERFADHETAEYVIQELKKKSDAIKEMPTPPNPEDDMFVSLSDAPISKDK